MKYAVKYLLILSLLGSSSISVYAQEMIDSSQEEIKLETEISTVQTNRAEFQVQEQSTLLNGQIVEEKIQVEYREGTFFLPARWTAEHLLSAYVSLEEGNMLRIRRQDTLILIADGAKEATVNGNTVPLKHTVYNEKGRYNICLEDLEMLFEVTSHYDEASDTLEVTGEDRRPNDKPEADFYFMKKHYVEGEEVIAVNISHDTNQDEIVATKWSVGEEEAVTAAKLSEIFSRPKAGSYKIGLQVQDERGLWSDWTYKTIKIAENKAPVIQILTTDKETYRPGESIIWDYTYTNEPGEAITNEKWMYRKSTQEAKLAVLGKPEAFFAEGEYIVTLQIDDAFGKRSKVIERTVHIKGEAIQSELAYRFEKGEIGDRIDNFENKNYRTDYEDAVIEEQGTISGTLMMSDSPETVKQTGVLYEDTIEGRGRILLHHLNQIETVDGKKQKLALVVSNDGEEAITLTLSNEAIKGPAADITRVGQKVVYDYLKGTEARTLMLQPGEKQYIYHQAWTKNQCISGMLDVETEGALRFSVIAVSEDVELEQMDGLERLPADGIHISGNFDVIGKTYTLNLDPTKPTKLLLGAVETGEWVNGVDARDGAIMENKGNFGVSYYVTITAQEDMGIFLNSRGGGFQGAIKWVDGTVYNVPTQGILGQLTTRAAVIGILQKGETKTFEYILPNGSAAPVLIGFVPTSYF
ncbi:MAG: hypothetical protein E7231_13790 [Cellulosilyticum sp.]|nr:hypothetical protein [Cellulosilyticum sp.]